jgi:hypothetical protein
MTVEQYTDIQDLYPDPLQLTVSPQHEGKEEYYRLLFYLLMRTYRAVEWKKILGRKQRASELFIKKVKAASVYPSIARFFEKLTHSLGVTSPTLQIDVIDQLQTANAVAMKILRYETQYIVQKAIELNFFLINQKKDDQNGN